MGEPVVHWEITARNPERAEDFYTRMFGWSVEADTPVSYRHVLTGTDSGIQGGIADRGGSWPSRALFYVEVDDVRESLARAEQLGGSTLVPPTAMDGQSTIAIFRDPEGVPVGLMQR